MAIKTISIPVASIAISGDLGAPAKVRAQAWPVSGGNGWPTQTVDSDFPAAPGFLQVTFDINPADYVCKSFVIASDGTQQSPTKEQSFTVLADVHVIGPV